MDFQAIIENNQCKDNSLAIAGLNYCETMRPAYNRGLLELCLVISDPAIVDLIGFVYSFRQFYDQCLVYAEHPTPVYRQILEAYYRDVTQKYKALESKNSC